MAEEATAVLAQAPGAAAPGAELDRAQRLLERAKRFGPDTPLVIRQGQASALLGRPEAGTRLFAEAARSEPSNFDAWRLLYAVTRKRDPGRAARARERALALDPQARIPAP